MSSLSNVMATLLGAGVEVASPYWLSFGIAVDLHLGGIDCRDALDLAY